MYKSFLYSIYSLKSLHEALKTSVRLPKVNGQMQLIVDAVPDFIPKMSNGIDARFVAAR